MLAKISKVLAKLWGCWAVTNLAGSARVFLFLTQLTLTQEDTECIMLPFQFSLRVHLWQICMGPLLCVRPCAKCGGFPSEHHPTFCPRGGRSSHSGIVNSFTRPHLQPSLDGLLLVVSCCALINHLGFLGGRPGTAPSAALAKCTTSHSQPPARCADAWETV